MVAEGLKVLDIVLPGVEKTSYDLGARRFHATGEVLPDSVVPELREQDAILLGAIGDPSVPSGVLERGLLLRLRFELDHHSTMVTMVRTDERAGVLQVDGHESEAHAPAAFRVRGCVARAIDRATASAKGGGHRHPKLRPPRPFRCAAENPAGRKSLENRGRLLRQLDGVRAVAAVVRQERLVVMTGRGHPVAALDRRCRAIPRPLDDRAPIARLRRRHDMAGFVGAADGVAVVGEDASSLRPARVALHRHGETRRVEGIDRMLVVAKQRAVSVRIPGQRARGRVCPRGPMIWTVEEHRPVPSRRLGADDAGGLVDVTRPWLTPRAVRARRSHGIRRVGEHVAVAQVRRADDARRLVGDAGDLVPLAATPPQTHGCSEVLGRQVRQRLTASDPWTKRPHVVERPVATLAGRPVRPLGPLEARERCAVPVPERADAMLRNAVVGRVEPREVDAVAVACQAADRLLHRRQVRAVVQAGHVRDEPEARAPSPDQFDGKGEHVAFVGLPLALASARPGSARRIADQQFDPIAKRPAAARRHAQEIPRVDLDRALAEVLLVRVARVRVVIERKIRFEAGAPKAFGHPARAGEDFDDHFRPRNQRQDARRKARALGAAHVRSCASTHSSWTQRSHW